MSRLMHTTFRQSGVGLVELMVALVLGLFVTAGITSMFVQNKGSYNQDERNARMQESARYALQLLARDLSMVGFWGGVVSSGSDISDPGSTDLPITQDCGASGVRWAFNPVQSIQYFKPANSSAVPSTEFQCVVNGTGYSYKANTSVLSVKHVAGVSTTLPESGRVYVRTVGASGNLVKSDGTATPSGQQDWQYEVNIYHVANDSSGIPWLRRKYLTHSGGTPTMEDEGQLAEGIEQFHIQFGIDTDGDGIPNQYLSDPTDTQLQTAVSARIYVLVRSSDQDFSYTDNKIYTLGDLSVNGGNAFNDRYYRRVYTTTVQLRNTQYQLLLQGATAS
ncbi:PilW family protein [Methylocaldum sp.]|uniref:PilW family protein n=1 Tax=Methylocaldum sp. TaxID=1969727 RepID=UPI002D431064|nr:PilW family protein [Methylocaldum sp.]HYE35758.1 PilW family protein [Methylocaldum sp.]